jgi:hypothetical protein
MEMPTAATSQMALLRSTQNNRSGRVAGTGSMHVKKFCVTNWITANAAIAIAYKYGPASVIFFISNMLKN